MSRWASSSPVRPVRPIAVAVVLIATLFAAQAAIASDATPTVRLLSPRSRNSPSSATGATSCSSTRAPGSPRWATTSSCRSNRPDYDTPITVKQVDSDSGRSCARSPPIDLDPLGGPEGLRAFHGPRRPRRDRRRPTRARFCPNGYVRQRLSDESPLNPGLPVLLLRRATPSPRDRSGASTTGGRPRSSATTTTGRPRLEGRARRATRSVSDRSRRGSTCSSSAPSRRDRRGARRRSSTAGRWRPSRRRQPASPQAPAAVPVREHPDRHHTPIPQTLPDLVRAPRLGDVDVPQHGHDYLGLQRDRVERGTRDDGGRRVPRPERVDDGRVPVLPASTASPWAGADRSSSSTTRRRPQPLAFRGVHPVLAARRCRQADDPRSVGKQSWCLVNTDALDLTVPNANLARLRPGSPDVVRRRPGCPLGPRGPRRRVGRHLRAVRRAVGPSTSPTCRTAAYYIRVQVNPRGRHPRVERRPTTSRIASIRLRGKPGHRRVIVPPWHGIDTEHYCPYCG